MGSSRLRNGPIFPAVFLGNSQTIRWRSYRLVYATFEKTCVIAGQILSSLVNDNYTSLNMRLLNLLNLGTNLP